MDFFDDVLENHDIEHRITNKKTPLSTDKILEFKEKFVKDLFYTFQDVEIYKKDVKYFEQEEIPVEQFFLNIQNELLKPN